MGTWAAVVSAIAALAGVSIVIGSKIGGGAGAAIGIAFFVLVAGLSAWLVYRHQQRKRQRPLITHTEKEKQLKVGPIPLGTRVEVTDEQVLEGESIESREDPEERNPENRDG